MIYDRPPKVDTLSCLLPLVIQLQVRGRKMKKDKLDLVWAACLIIIGLGSLIVSLNNVFDFGFPNTMIKPIGIVDLITLPVLAFTTVKKFQKDK